LDRFQTSQPQQQLAEIQGPWQATITAAIEVATGKRNPPPLAEYWGQRPVLIRNAFSTNELQKQNIIPTWEDIVSLACYCDDESSSYVEAAESARWIRHVPGDPTSFDVELGPFEREQIQEQIMKTTKKSQKQWKWTLLVNDVDRYHVHLSHWMDSEFSFLPRWRRDDAQISLAGIDGGIGPHVDNYDVFLIQVTGQRQWILGQSTLSVMDERRYLIPNIPVSILRLLEQTISSSDDDIPSFDPVTLSPGDVLYIPPRFVHCGTALTNDCMTLSVGCRAPSASELVARVAERIQDSAMSSAVSRYTDINLFDAVHPHIGPSITMDMKNTMKQLVRSAVDDLLNNETEWDELVGTLTTEAIRYSENAMIPLVEESDAYHELWGKSAKEVLQRVIMLENKAALIRTPGISIAYSQVPRLDKKNDDIHNYNNNNNNLHSNMAYRLFVHGEMWEVDSTHSEAAAILFRCMERGQGLDGTVLSSLIPTLSPLLEDLVERGILRANQRSF
jgi:50S ribosomal protein L16 3-hydroxylase